MGARGELWSPATPTLLLPTPLPPVHRCRRQAPPLLSAVYYQRTALTTERDSVPVRRLLTSSADHVACNRPHPGRR